MTDQPWTGRRVHVLGIGGAGMSAYALAAQALGATVTGSDRASSPYLERVRAAGIAAVVGHDGANVPAGDGVEVFASTAVPADNPEVVAAHARGLEVRPREDLLAELTALRRTIAVAGAHGKTTTSAMVAHVLLECGLDPGYLIGGVVRSTGSNGAWGGGEWLVVEADESDRSMLRLHVDVAVVTNVELDHHATYADLDELEDCFRAFLRGAPQAIVWRRPELLALREKLPVIAYDVDDADAALSAQGSRFAWRGEEVVLRVPGIHNARNAAAALEASALVGVAPADAVRAIGTFAGAGRRFERLGETAWGALVVDDYAHHPTEVAATIAAARTLGAGRRVVAIFQPHLYSRTQALAGDFGTALRGADEVVLLDVYPARERAEDFPGVSSQLVVWATDDRAHWWRRPESAPGLLEKLSGRGDVLLFMGAGDIDRLARSFVV
ncbi:UDP-N-acetylmuramate--L-alanine ligase [Capillimicrobium parvum]|uniref:UDP-N-acetylmuramate--L-alanine ligase n=1 Tax=Capillimicrobium parvum TaxID=2884022 RepID=A0A9E6XXS9_9ACTN|nr:UDP-N-acetylmuramate--L-alanine ligase [Capillimicrobium parvum]UGS35751.1 UDP-N-acetylmuramate--L-alanine ligase [Capillimicrobium parvum]